MAHKLFVFNRDLPAPFKTKTTSVSSTYGDGTNAKLTATVLKGLLAYCKIKDGEIAGALGTVDAELTVAEYHSAEADKMHLVAFKTGGLISAVVYDTNDETFANYTVGSKDRDGAALILALIPVLAEDKEFKENLELFYEDYQASFGDMKVATEHAGILCDNAYRRISDDACTAHVKVSIDNSGNVAKLARGQMDSGKYTPRNVICGEFTVLAQTGPAQVLTPSDVIPHADFVGQYPLNETRAMTAFEQSMIPVLEPWYILPHEVVSICRHAKTSSSKQLPMRNFLLRGPAGTGKTEGAKAIAAGLGLPYMKYTCSANTEVYDFIGQVFPVTDAGSTGDAQFDAERKQLMTMGGINYENVSKIMNLPGLDDMDYDPAGVYKQITGRDKADASSQDCMAVVLSMVTDKVQRLSMVEPETKSSGQTYTYIETDFIKALKYGYLVEIQEPSTIMQPGVLVGLNSLLEQTGSITLPTGEVVKRHPDTVIVVTTNVSYEGCRGINQSVLDRMSLVQDIELPPAEVMAQRAMSITGCEDDFMVSQMVQIVNDMSVYCHKNGITDGSVGMRSLIDWIISTEITGDPHMSAMYTVISKASADDEDRSSLITTILEPIFPPKRVRKAV